MDINFTFGKDVHALTSVNGIIYAATWGYGVYKSTDNGSTWIQINNGLGAFLAMQSITSTSNGDVYVGTVGGGVFKTTDGTNWTQLTIGYNVIWAMGSTSTAVFAELTAAVFSNQLTPAQAGQLYQLLMFSSFTLCRLTAQVTYL